jgi:hypothetical protein
MRTLFDHVNNKPAHVTGTVVCAMRPLPGDHMWTAESIGNGVYYASGDVNEYGKTWTYLDAAIVQYLTDTDILAIIHERLEQDGITAEDIAGIDINQLCDIYKLPHIAQITQEV